ncbi:MAG: ABC transporter ATP-binding protein [Flavobacteriales bacterium]|nr:ABC transporter ATP-binding protein [Flavobacteriales bacterium]
MSPLNRIIKIANKYKTYYYIGIFFNTLYSLFSIFSIASMIPLLSILFGTVDGTTKKNILEPSNSLFNSFDYYKKYLENYLIDLINEQGAEATLTYLCVFVCITFFVRNLFRYFAQFFIVNFKTSINLELRNNLFDKILSLPVRFFTEKRKGDTMQRMFDDIREIGNNILNPFIDLARAPFMLVFTLIFLFYMQPKLTLFALVVLPIMGFIISTIGKSLKTKVRTAQEQTGLLYSLVDETTTAPKIIKIFNAESIIGKKFHDLAKKIQGLELKIARRYELASPTSEFLGSITMVLIVWFGGNIILSNQAGMKAPDFLAFIGLFFQMIEPAKTISVAFANLSKGKISAERYFEIIDTDLHVEESKNAISISELKEGITFENVTFQYEENQPIIKNFSFFIPKGKSIALVGQSGSGKTTLANLIARFYDVTSGRILIDGKDIKELKIADYRKLLGMVTQESVLFNDTIKNNILLGKSNATDQEVINASKISNSLEFIEKLPHKFDTGIGELGGMVSGGQKQRISIARAVLKNPPIMILDEATSALDTESERLVQEALENMMQNRTSIVIAHRLSTIQNCDIIVVMNQGEIVEQGSHDELMQKKGKYYQLVELQNFA